MSHCWLSYLPPHLAADLLAHATIAPLDRVMRSDAVALFADISGFTPMSEALGKVGPKGTEELSKILNRTFGAMIEIVHFWGGSIGKFAGDALTVLFLFQPATQQITVQRAVQCALEIQTSLMTQGQLQTRAGTFALTIKIGLGMGDLLTTTVGDPAIRLEYLIAGSAIDRCAAAEHHAPKGAVVVTNDLLPFLRTPTVTSLAPGFSQIIRLHRRPLPPTLAALIEPTPSTVEMITRYLPSAIAERLTQGQDGFVDEHRTLTTLFVRFSGVDYQDAAALDHLQSYLREVVRTIARYDGSLRQIDVGDKGSLYIVLFGAPIAHEDDAERAMLCALELRSVANRLKITTATGITTGKIFCGMVGSDRRREYAAIGDSVNLAARLMSSAQPNQILVDAATRQRLTTPFDWHELPPLTVKGKREPITIAALERGRQRSHTRLRAPSYTLPMVGRQTELAQLQERLDRARHSQGQIVGITAEAGMGKSRLVTELMRSASTKQFLYVTSECLSYGTQSSYLVWQGILRGLFDLTPELAPEAQLEHIQSQLTTLDPALLDRMPLLSPIIQLAIPDNEFTRALDPELRKTTLHALVLACLRGWAKQYPLLLILEDCHWIDPLSDELLTMLTQRLSDVPLFLLITHRPLETDHLTSSQQLLQARSLPAYYSFTLAAFDRAETAQLVELKLERMFGDSGQVPPLLLDRIVERAQGNPFYIDELLNLLHDRGVDVRDAQALAQIDLPDSIQRLILSRIDRLAEGPKLALKLASIIGRLFRAAWVKQLAPQISDDQLHAHFAQLQQQDFTQLERREPETEYLFKHLITCEVAYESLAYATRTQLHEQVGMLIERTYAHQLSSWLDVLAHHYGLSNNVPKQREYFRKAGDAAKQTFANTAAVHYYERLLMLLPEEEQVEVLLALSTVEQHMGQWQVSEEHARKVMELAATYEQQELYAQAVTALGCVLRYTGRLDEAITLLEPAHQLLRTMDAPRTLLGLLHELGSCKYYQGHADAFVTTQQERLQLAIKIDEPMHRCESLMNIGVVFIDKWQPEQAITLFEEALELATTHRLQRLLPMLFGNLGLAYGKAHDHAGALNYFHQELEAGLRVGYQEAVVHALFCSDQVYRALGMQAQATRCALAAFAVMGEPMGIFWTCQGLHDLGFIAVHWDKLHEAEACIQRGVALSRIFAMPWMLAMNLTIQLLIYVKQQRYHEAQSCLEEMLTLAEQHQIRNLLLEGHQRTIWLQWQLKQIDTATAIARLECLRAEVSDEEAHALAYTIWQIDSSREDERATAIQYYRDHYLTSYSSEDRQRYQELTGHDLPDPPSFPAPPAVIDDYQLDLATLLQRVDRLLACTASVEPATLADKMQHTTVVEE